MGWSSRGRMLLIVCFVEIVLLDSSARHIATSSEFGGQLNGDNIFVQAFRSTYPEQKPRAIRDDHSQPIVNNLLIQIFLNAKNVSQLNSSKHVANIRKQVTFESGRETGRSPLGSTDNPIIIVKDFDRETLTFIDDHDKKLAHNPESLVEVKAIVSGLDNDTSNMMQSGQINEEVDRKLHSSIPIIMERLNGIKKHDDAPPAESQTLEEAFGETNLAKKITHSEDSIANEQMKTEESETTTVSGNEGSLELLSTLSQETEDDSQHQTTTSTPNGERDEEILASELDKAIEEAVVEVSKESETTMQAGTENEEQAIGDEIERTLFKEISNGQHQENRFTTTIHGMDMLTTQSIISQTFPTLELGRTTLERVTDEISPVSTEQDEVAEPESGTAQWKASTAMSATEREMQSAGSVEATTSEILASSSIAPSGSALSSEMPFSVESSTKSSEISSSMTTPEFSTVEMTTAEKMGGTTDEESFQKTTEEVENTVAESFEQISTNPATTRSHSFVTTTELASEGALNTETAIVERPSESFSPSEGDSEIVPTMATTSAAVEIGEAEDITATSTEETPDFSETPETLLTASTSTSSELSSTVAATVEEETPATSSTAEYISTVGISATEGTEEINAERKSSSAFVTEELQHETTTEIEQEPFATGAFLPTEETTSHELQAESTSTTGGATNTVTQSTSESAETFSTFGLSEGITGSSQTPLTSISPFSSISTTEGESFLTEGATTSEPQTEEASAEISTTAGLTETINAGVPQRPETLFPAKAVEEKENEEAEGSTEGTETTIEASTTAASEIAATIVSSAASEMTTAEHEEGWSTKPLPTSGEGELTAGESTEATTTTLMFIPATTLSEEEEEYHRGLTGLPDMEKTNEETIPQTTEKATVGAELNEGPVTSTMQTEESVENFTQLSTDAITHTTILPQIPQQACTIPNDKSDTTKLDILFLLDTSSSIGETQFQRALKLIIDTVKEFRNIGPDGIQVSLVQFNHEPYLEFSFRKHNCKPELLEDIADTVYMKGISNLGNAIDKVAKFGFNKRRGDRPNAENVLVILTDGMSDDKIQQPLQLVRKNGTAVFVIAAIEARPELVRELVDHQESNIFNLSDALERPLAERLSQRIRESQLEAIPPFSTVMIAEVTESITAPSILSSTVTTEAFTTEEPPYTTTTEAITTEEHSPATEAIERLEEVFTSTAEMKTASENIQEESVISTTSGKLPSQTTPREEEESFLESSEASSISVDDATTKSATETTVEPEITGGPEFSSVQEGKESTEEAMAFIPEIATTMPSKEGEGTHEAEEITSVKPEEEEPGEGTHEAEETTSLKPEEEEPGEGTHEAEETTSLKPEEEEPGEGTHEAKETTSLKPEEEEPGERTHGAEETTSLKPEEEEPGEGTHGAEKVSSMKPEEESKIEEEGIATSAEELPTIRPTSTVEETRMELSEHISFTGDVSVQCLENGFNLTLRLPQSFAGMIIVKGHSESEGCYKEVNANESANNEALRNVSFFVDAHKCAISKVKSVDPPGMNTSAVVNVLHHKWLVTGVDKGYLIQCFMANVKDGHDISTELNVNGTILIGETLSLASIPPTCLYSLRRDSPNGPIVKYAFLGQTIYHRWECDGDDAANEVYGMYVHDCFAGSDTSHEFPIVDSKGCSPNKNILSDLSYADDRLMASARSSVFSMADIEHLLFHCKISLCTRQGDGCEGITPPKCSSSNDTDLLLREVRHFPEAISAALTSVVEADVDVSSLSSPLVEPTSSLSSILLSTIQSPIFWILIALTVIAILATLILIRYIRKVNAKSIAVADAEGILYKRRSSDLREYSSNICYTESCDCAITSVPSSTSIAPCSVCTMASTNGDECVHIDNEQRSIGVPKELVTVEFHPTCTKENDQLSSASSNDIRQQRIANSGTSEVINVVFDPFSEHT